MVETPLKILELSLIGNSELIVYRKVDVCLTVPASSAFHVCGNQGPIYPIKVSTRLRLDHEFVWGSVTSQVFVKVRYDSSPYPGFKCSLSKNNGASCDQEFIAFI